MPDHVFARISVIGLGYIGLPTAAMFAASDVKVIGVDVNTDIVNTINRGDVHIVEPGLEKLVRAVVRKGSLIATSLPEPADAFLIAVPTPFKDGNHEPDLTYIEAAARSIAPVLESGNLVILESTSPVGTTEKMSGWLAEARPDLSFPQAAGELSDILIAHCPERVMPGRVLQELVLNDRIIGGMTARCSRAASRLYSIFVDGECIIASAPSVAELTKLTENSFRDVNIAFANEMSMICDELGVGVWEVLKLANRHPRVSILQPGPGVGGHCIAVDPWFIVSSAPKQAHLIRAAREVNDSKSNWVIEKINLALSEYLATHPTISSTEVSIAIYGLAFKSNIDDLRESPALAIAHVLTASHNGPIVILEPNIDVLPAGLEGAKLMGAGMPAADIHVMLVDHDEFKSQSRPAGVVLDLRGLWETL